MKKALQQLTDDNPYIYSINKYITFDLKQEILNKLSLSSEEFDKKMNARLKDNIRFSTHEFDMIQNILNKNGGELINSDVIHLIKE